jgi:hypothetical protein
LPRFESLAKYGPPGAAAPSLAAYVARHITDAAGDQQPDRSAISWCEQAGKIHILETNRVSVRSDAPAIADFRSPIAT